MSDRGEMHDLLDGDEWAPGTEPPPLDDHERAMVRHLPVVAAMLIEYGPRYRALLAQRAAEGATDTIRALAFDAAGTIGLVLQSTRRWPLAIAALREHPWNPTTALGALDQLFDSFVLLTAPEGEQGDEQADSALDEEELDELLELEGVQRFLTEMGARAE